MQRMGDSNFLQMTWETTGRPTLEASSNGLKLTNEKIKGRGGISRMRPLPTHL